MKRKTFTEGLNKAETVKQTKAVLKQIGELQHQLYAESKHSLLLVFQGMDASGKDGLTRDLFKYCNPVGISVKSFKKPTPEEYAHDFLWRVHRHSPPKGAVQVFIRSHYEDILVPTVENLFTPEIIEERYQLINNFEQLLAHNGTRILKFFLHISAKEQELRLTERMENHRKFWKHNDGDWETRKKFDQYLEVYESILTRCNHIPWQVIPSDRNWEKLWYVANSVLRALEEMNIQWPALKTELR
ncbi:MAG: PPK2 family polyphosphate kinase [Mangrovibacterium sp.]